MSSAVLCQTNGRGWSFQLVIQVRMDLTRSRTERWVPRFDPFGGELGEPALDEVHP